MMPSTEITAMSTPTCEMSRSGLSENPMMPSRANLIIFFSGYPVSPAWRACRSNFTAVCRNPT